ncbi:MAG: GNAT family N-acetyltransferase [Peptostreptococcaceae bacterium]
MEIRKIQIEDANSYLDMLLNLDTETKFMMFEPNERSTDINITKNIIEKTVHGDNLILVATDRENMIGFISVQKGGPKRIKHTGYIVIGIREQYRGKGIGSKLFSELDMWAIENKITRLELSVICSNTIAKHLYEKNGFEVEGIKKNAMIIDDKYVDEFYMAKIYNNL